MERLRLPARLFARGGVVLGLAAIAGMTTGCGSKPIPLVAVAGTTITLAIPMNFTVGYGRALVGDWDITEIPPLTDEDSPLEDLQNGELWIGLENLATGVETSVEVRQILRVGADPASRMATNPPGVSVNLSKGQAIAFLDIPADLPAGDYEMRVYRLRRRPGSVPGSGPYEPFFWEQLHTGEWWTGWGDGSSPTGVPITVLEHDGQEHFTPLVGWLDHPAVGGLGSQDVSADLQLLAPFPEVEIRVPEAAVSLSETPPAAWELEVDYPRHILRIRGVSIADLDRSTAIVMWDAADPDATVSCSEPADTLKIQVIDPERRTLGVRVAYQLRNFAESCGRRAVNADFVPDPASFVAYDDNGVELASSYQILPFDE